MTVQEEMRAAMYEHRVERMAAALHRDCELEWQAIAVVDPDRQITQHFADDAQRIAHGIAERARAAAPDVVAAREADDSKHRDRARAKADQVWRERHPEEA